MSGKVKTFWNNAYDISKTFLKSLGRSCKSLWRGNPADNGFMRHSGKAFVTFAAVLTTILTANTIIRAKNMAQYKNKNTIDKTKESTVI